ncbi:toll/interleukin-1 receptor domain-containing protein [Streptomyces sp. NPDC059455]|uniref:toll/interleukin-1 receptor domain-containing protein n=1 Tax=Streptomyces sp. NPDC059455 TaxID=3346837 RepID=UPI0036774DB7
MHDFIFVSHSTSDPDAHLTEAICDFFTRAGIGTANFFCSSYSIQAMELGEDDLRQIYDHLDRAQIFIEIMTKSYLTRPHCLMEVGYAIARHRQSQKQTKGRAGVRFAPLVIPPLDFSDVNALHRKYAIKLSNAEQCRQFTQRIRNLLADLSYRLDEKTWTQASLRFQRKWATALGNYSASIGST